MKPRTLAAAALAASLAAPAFAEAPQPAKSVDPARLAGRWYEQARLPSGYQKDCHASTFDWTRTKDGALDVVLSCRLGSPAGKLKVQKAKGRILDPKTNARMKVSFMGGLASAEYRILDRADDYSWMLLGTSGGRYFWILSSRPRLPAAAREQAVARAGALGYPVAKLIQAPAE